MKLAHSRRTRFLVFFLLVTKTMCASALEATLLSTFQKYAGGQSWSQIQIKNDEIQNPNSSNVKYLKKGQSSVIYMSPNPNQDSINVKDYVAMKKTPDGENLIAASFDNKFTAMTYDDQFLKSMTQCRQEESKETKAKMLACSIPGVSALLCKKEGIPDKVECLTVNSNLCTMIYQELGAKNINDGINKLHSCQSKIKNTPTSSRAHPCDRIIFEVEFSSLDDAKELIRSTTPQDQPDQCSASTKQGFSNDDESTPGGGHDLGKECRKQIYISTLKIERSNLIESAHLLFPTEPKKVFKGSSLIFAQIDSAFAETTYGEGKERQGNFDFMERTLKACIDFKFLKDKTPAKPIRPGKQNSLPGQT